MRFNIIIIILEYSGFVCSLVFTVEQNTIKPLHSERANNGCLEFELHQELYLNAVKRIGKRERVSKQTDE